MPRLETLALKRLKPKTETTHPESYMYAAFLPLPRAAIVDVFGDL